MYDSPCYDLIPSTLCERHAPHALSYDSYCTLNSVLNSSQIHVLILVHRNFDIPLHLLIQCNFLSAKILLYRDANIKQVTAVEEGCGPLGLWEKKRRRNDWHACWIEVWSVFKIRKGTSMASPGHGIGVTATPPCSAWRGEGRKSHSPLIGCHATHHVLSQSRGFRIFKGGYLRSICRDRFEPRCFRSRSHKCEKAGL